MIGCPQKDMSNHKKREEWLSFRPCFHLNVLKKKKENCQSHIFSKIGLVNLLMGKLGLRRVVIYSQF